MKRNIVSIIILYFVIFIITVTDGKAIRAIPDDHLSHSVLITLGDNSKASGFYLNYKNKNIYLVSAKHVFFNDEKDGSSTLKNETAILLSYSKYSDWSNPAKIQLNLKTLTDNGHIKPHLSKDIVVIKLATVRPEKKSKGKLVKGVKQLSKKTLLAVPFEQTKKFADVLVGNDAYISGYPTSLGIKNIPQLNLNRPLLRKGLIAGKNEKEQTIILDCPVYYGNSGGPVVEKEQISINQNKFHIIGIVSQFVPFVEEWLNLKHKFKNIQVENSGYSIVEPVDSIISLIEEFD